MLSMEHDIQIGGWRLGAVAGVSIKKSVEALSDTAVVTLPGSYAGVALDVEECLKEGDAVTIRLGYGNRLATEFEGFLKSVKTDDGTIQLECEDALYLLRVGVENKEYKNIKVGDLLNKIAGQVGGGIGVRCDYDFRYDKFVVKDATGWDVLKKVQEETKANIYFKGETLHVHPQYSEIFNAQAVVYDFSSNVEESSLTYKRADERSYLVEVEGIGADGKRVSVSHGRTGGDKRSLKVYGVSDVASLKKRAEEELVSLVYEGFDGSFTGWLVPYCEPGYKVTLRDAEYPSKNGNYYVVATEVSFGPDGGKRTVTIGKKI